MRYAVVVIAVVLLAYLVMDFNSRTAELNRLRAEQEVVAARLENHESTRDALQTQIAYATSEAAVVRWAHENHMARPGEHAVVPMQPALSTPAPRPRPTAEPKEVSNLEQWLALFIDPQVGE
jgi:hypothetical protein